MKGIYALATTLNYGTSMAFLATVGSIGWALTVYCLVDKFDRKKDKLIHLMSDIVNATFAAITLVAAVAVAVNLSIRLPDVISVRLAQDIHNLAPTKLTTVQPAPATLADEILLLSREKKLTDASLTAVLQRQFKGISYYEGGLILKGDNRQFKIAKNFEAVLNSPP